DRLWVWVLVDWPGSRINRSTRTRSFSRTIEWPGELSEDADALEPGDFRISIVRFRNRNIEEFVTRWVIGPLLNRTSPFFRFSSACGPPITSASRFTSPSVTKT